MIVGARRLLSFKRRESWESGRKWVERDFWKSGWAEDPNLSRAWADFKVKSGCLGLCPVVSDTSKDKDCYSFSLSFSFFLFHSLSTFSSLWPPSLEKFSLPTSKQISLNFFLTLVSVASTLSHVLPRSLWLHFPCNHPYTVEYSSYFTLFISLNGLSKHSYQFSNMSCLHHY